MIYADVIIDISHEKLDRTFLYRVPEEMEGKIQAGMFPLAMKTSFEKDMLQAFREKLTFKGERSRRSRHC